jgi:phytanoyl-CoA hydroxylase
MSTARPVTGTILLNTTGETTLSPAALAAYNRNGFIVLPDILEPAQVEELRRVTDRLVENTRSVATNDEIYDFKELHSPDAPRVRRIKTPHLHDPEYARGARHPKIVEALQYLYICGAPCASIRDSSA